MLLCLIFISLSSFLKLTWTFDKEGKENELGIRFHNYYYSKIVTENRQGGCRIFREAESRYAGHAWGQSSIDNHQSSIHSPSSESKDTGCACIHVSDVYISFSDGSLKRPDISIFCQEPEEEDEAIKQVPYAVIEVISKGYEATIKFFQGVIHDTKIIRW